MSSNERNTKTTQEMKQFDLLAMHGAKDCEASMNHSDIAKLIGSRIDSVKRTIERLAESGVIQLPPTVVFEEINGLGVVINRRYYNFSGKQGQRDSIVVVAQICPEFTAQLVDRWSILEEENARLRNKNQITKPEHCMNTNILYLAQVVAEATASATMKAVMEISAIKEPVNNELKTNAIGNENIFEDIFGDIFSGFTKKPENSLVSEDGEYIHIPKISWETTLSDPSCRKLVEFANLPTKKYKGSHGLMVHRSSFMLALQALIEESAAPSGGRKRWKHPEFGGYKLNKDPKEIFGEAQ